MSFIISDDHFVKYFNKIRYAWSVGEIGLWITLDLYIKYSDFLSSSWLYAKYIGQYMSYLNEIGKVLFKHTLI